MTGRRSRVSKGGPERGTGGSDGREFRGAELGRRGGAPPLPLPRAAFGFWRQRPRRFEVAEYRSLERERERVNE